MIETLTSQVRNITQIDNTNNIKIENQNKDIELIKLQLKGKELEIKKLELLQKMKIQEIEVR